MIPDDEVASRVDDALADSFPASDPPPWTLGPPRWVSAGNAAAARDLARWDSVRREHRNLEGLLFVLESLLARVARREVIDRALIADLLAYVRSYLSGVHSLHEQRALDDLATYVPFVRALRPVIASHGATTASTMAALQNQVDAANIDAPQSAADLARAGFAFTRALRSQIVFEEALLVSIAAIASAAAAPIESCARDRAEHELAEEQSFRAEFEALTKRVGCGCGFE